MIEVAVTAFAPVLAAAMCWALYVNGFKSIGNAGLAVALLQLYSLAVLPMPVREPQIVAGNESGLYHDAAAECAQKLKGPKVYFVSREEADENRDPCPACMTNSRYNIPSIANAMATRIQASIK